MSIKGKVINGFIWRFLQNASAQIINFVISIYLGRLLDPGDYGLVAMISVFLAIASVFVDPGFSSSVVQKKNINDIDLNTLFWSSLITAVILYAILYLFAPLIADFYNQEKLINLLRIESITIVIASLYTVQNSLLQRELKFKNSFVVRIGGAIAHGIVGIYLAAKGFGPYALVYSAIGNNITTAIIIWLVVNWRPRLCFSYDSFRNMFSYSFRILSSSLLDTIYNNVRSLIIGKVYSAEDLAFYNRGEQFPTVIMTQIDGSISAVLFPTLSKYQDNWEEGLQKLRRSIKTSFYICTPLMAGLCAVARPMILLLLTDKWSGSIEYVRMAAIICAFWPLSANNHALNALGKSKVTLRINTLSKIISLGLLLLTYRKSVKLMILSVIISSLICTIINSFIYQKELNYRLSDQISDISRHLALYRVINFVQNR